MRARRDEDIAREIRSHLELEAEELQNDGLSVEDARAAAHKAFGNVTLAHEEARRVWTPTWLEQLVQDARYAWRVLRRSPGFTITAIVSMALGIGANTVVFSVLNSVLFRPLAVSEPEQLLFVQRGSGSSISYPRYRDLRDRSQTLEGAIAYRPARMAVDEGHGAERYWGYLATGNYFDVLGLKPARGRFFHADDEKGVNASPYAVISYDFWQSRFGGEENVVGRSVRVNGLPYSVLGVAPRGFRGTEAFLLPDLWVPMMMEPQIEGRNWLELRSTHNAWVMVRAKPGVSPRQVATDLNRVSAELAKEYPRESGEPRFVLARPGLLGNQLRNPVEQFVAGLMLVAAALLLAACTNLAGLLGARATDRFREIAIRVSIGAGRARILRQLLTESIVLTGIAGASGCLLAWFVLRALSGWRPPIEIPLQMNVVPDYRVLLFAVAVSVLTGVLAGVAPAWQAWRTNPGEAMKGTANRAGRKWAIRDAILVLQTALCGALVVCSLVAARGLLQTFSVRAGYDPAGLSVVAFDPNLAGYPQEQSNQFQRRALDAVSQLPGVVSAAFAKSVPLTTDQSNTTVFPEEAVERRQEQARSVGYYDVSPGYFRTMGTRLLAGREFDWYDTLDRAAVAIVNETFARRLFQTTNAVGRRFRSYSGSLVEIVGVVEDGKYFTITEDPRPVLFQSILRERGSETVLIVRSSQPEASMASDMARAVKALDPAVPLYGVGSISALIGMAYLPAWVASVALGAFGLLAMTLAVTGIYGLASYSVSQRVREIGVRRALGARPLDVLRTVLGRVAVLVSAGSLAGLLLGLASGSILANVVYQASPRDPLTLTAVALIMLVVAVASGLGPIRRAISADPLRALRQE